MKLTKRGEAVLYTLVLIGFLAVWGFAGHIEGL